MYENLKSYTTWYFVTYYGKLIIVPCVITAFGNTIVETPLN